MMEWLVRTALCIGLIFTESVLYGVLGVENFTLQLGLSATIVLGLSRNFTLSAFVLIFLLAPMEWTVSGEAGHYSLAAVVVFFLLRFLAPRIKVNKAQIFLVAFFAALLHSGIMILSIFLQKPASPSIAAIFSNMIWAAFLVCFGALLVDVAFQVVRRFHDPMMGKKGLSRR